MMQYHLLNGICFWRVNLPRDFQDSRLLLKIMSNPLGLGLGVMSNPLGFLYFRFFPPTAGSILAGPHKMFTVDCVPAQLPDCPLLKHIDLPLGCPNLLVQLLQAVKRLKWPEHHRHRNPPRCSILGKTCCESLVWPVLRSEGIPHCSGGHQAFLLQNMRMSNCIRGALFA